MMGAILGRPVELVRCETSDLLVPASAEIVVEGSISIPIPKTFADEGPVRRISGYLGGMPSPKPVVEVTCVTHRDDPILRGALEGARPGFPSEDFAAVLLFTGRRSPGTCWTMSASAASPTCGCRRYRPAPTSWCRSGKCIAAMRSRSPAPSGDGGRASGSSRTSWSSRKTSTSAIRSRSIGRSRSGSTPAWAQLLTFGPTFGSVLDPSTPRASGQPAKYGTGKWTRVLIDATRNWEFEPKPGLGQPPLSADQHRDRRARRENQIALAEYGIGMDYLDDEQREMLTMAEMRKKLPEV